MTPRTEFGRPESISTPSAAGCWRFCSADLRPRLRARLAPADRFSLAVSSGSTQLSTDNRQQRRRRNARRGQREPPTAEQRAHTDSLNPSSYPLGLRLFAAPKISACSAQLSSLGQMIYCRLSALEARPADKRTSLRVWRAGFARLQYCLSSRAPPSKGFFDATLAAAIISSQIRRRRARQGSSREMIAPS